MEALRRRRGQPAHAQQDRARERRDDRLAHCTCRAEHKQADKSLRPCDGGIVQRWRHAASRRRLTSGPGAWQASCGWVVECWQHSGWVCKLKQQPQAGRCAILRYSAKQNLSAVMAARPIARRAPRERLGAAEEGRMALVPTLSGRAGARIARRRGPDGARGPDQGWVPNGDPSGSRPHSKLTSPLKRSKHLKILEWTTRSELLWPLP